MILNTVNVLSILLMLGIIPTVWMVYRKKIKFFSGVFLGTFLFLLSFVCSMYCIHIEYGYSPVDVVLGDSINQVVDVYSSTPGITAEDIQTIRLNMEHLKQIYIMFLPTVLVLGNLMWVYIIFMVSKGIFAIFNKDVSVFEKFCSLKMSRMAVILSVISLILSQCVQNPQLNYAFANFFVIIFIVSAMCGLSVVDYAFRKKLKISVLRMVIYIVVIFSVSFVWGSLLPAIGLIDAFLDFRKIRKKSI